MLADTVAWPLELGLGLTLTAACANLVARHAKADAGVSDALRIFLYAACLFAVTRLAVVPLFLLQLHEKPWFGAATFLLWIVPLGLSGWFAARAVRRRYGALDPGIVGRGRRLATGAVPCIQPCVHPA